MRNPVRIKYPPQLLPIAGRDQLRHIILEGSREIDASTVGDTDRGRHELPSSSACRYSHSAPSSRKRLSTVHQHHCGRAEEEDRDQYPPGAPRWNTCNGRGRGRTRTKASDQKR
jgi:hypothetical protein